MKHNRILGFILIALLSVALPLSAQTKSKSTPNWGRLRAEDHRGQTLHTEGSTGIKEDPAPGDLRQNQGQRDRETDEGMTVTVPRFANGRGNPAFCILSSHSTCFSACDVDVESRGVRAGRGARAQLHEAVV